MDLTRFVAFVFETASIFLRLLLSLLLPLLSLFFFLSFCRREQRFAGSSFRLAINAGMEQDVRTLSERYRPSKQFRPLKIIKILGSLLSYVLSLCKSTVYREVSLPCRIFQGWNYRLRGPRTRWLGLASKHRNQFTWLRKMNLFHPVPVTQRQPAIKRSTWQSGPDT